MSQKAIKRGGPFGPPHNFYSSSSLSTAMASKQSPLCAQCPDGHCLRRFLASPFPAKPAALGFGGRAACLYSSSSLRTAIKASVGS